MTTASPPDVPGAPPPLEDVRGARLVSRLAVDFLLRSMSDVAALFDGDFARAMIFLTVAQASVVGDRKASHSVAQFSDGVMPDTLRRPVSTMAVANALGMPRETVRRHVNQLVADGFCVRLPDRRILVTEEIIRREDVTQTTQRNILHFRRMVDIMKRENIL